MTDCPWDRGEVLARNGPPPPPIRRRPESAENERDRERRREREKRFDPERPPERYARPHHFAVNPEMQFETWLRAVNVMVMEQFEDEVGYIDIDEELLLDPLLGQPEWAGELPPSACVAWNAGLTAEQYFDWLMTSVQIQNDRSEWENED